MPMLPEVNKKRVYGWGRSTFSNSSVFQTTTINGIHRVLEHALKTDHRITCRGAGRSYGDNTLNFAGPWRRVSIARLVGEALGLADEDCDALEKISSVAQALQLAEGVQDEGRHPGVFR